MAITNMQDSGALPSNLSQTGENLVAVNPEFFIAEEKLRMKIRADREEDQKYREQGFKPLLAFTVFDKLVPELRRMIWKLAARSECRVVEFTYYSVQKTMAAKFPSKTLVPAIMHTSSEARACGREIYEKLEFGGHFYSTYINWDLDVVAFSSLEVLKTFLNMEDDLNNGVQPVAQLLATGVPSQAVVRPPLVHSPLNLNCRKLLVGPWKSNVAFRDADIDLLKHFPQLDEVMTGHFNDGYFTRRNRDGQGNVTFSALPAKYEDTAAEYQQLLKIITRAHHHIKTTSSIIMSRDTRKIMTNAQKQERKKVEQGKMEIEEARQRQAKREEAQKSAAQKLREQKAREKVKMFEDDMILAAMLQAENP